MIALDIGDKLRADASVAAKVDYTIHGVVEDAISQVSDGQLADTEADIYTAPCNAVIITTIILVNTHTSAITCNLYLKPASGTSRRIIPKDMEIGIGHVLTFDGVNLAVTNPQGNVVFYVEGDIVTTPSGYTQMMKQADDTLTVPLVDADGHVQVDVLSGGDSNDSVATEGVAATKGTQIALDDGTDSHYAQANAAGDLKVTLDSEAVVLGAGSATIGKLAANSGVDIGDVDIVSQPADTFAAEDAALGKGVLLQGDDGADRKNVAVDTAGHLQIDVLSGGGSNDSVATEGVAATKGTQISLDDGTDSHYAQANASGDLKVTLDSEAVVLGAGSAAIGKLAANSGVDIGDVDVKSLPNRLATWTQVVVNIGTATTTELIAASAGHTYTILTISLTIAAENNLTFKSAANAKTGPMDFGGSGESHGWQANFWPVGIKCVTGEALNLTTSTTGQVSGIICVLDES